METFLFVVTLLVNGGIEKHVVDYNLTLEDCQNKIVKIEPLIKEHQIVSVSCVNSEFYQGN